MEPVLATRYVFTITAHIGGVTSAGEIGIGERRIIPIVGGEVRGHDLNGKILSFGADFQIVRPDSSIDLEAKYAIESDDGAVIYVENRGIRRGPIELVQKLNRGEAVDLLVGAASARKDDADASYDLLRRIDYFEPSSKVSRRKLQNLIDAELKLGTIDASLAPERLVMPGVTELVE